MKKALIMAGALVALAASLASADGINAAWNDCGGASNVNFACTSNTGQNFVVLSYVIDNAGTAPSVIGYECVLDMQVSAASKPCWWNFAGTPPTGRAAATNVNTAYTGAGCFDFLSSLSGGPNVAGGWVDTGAARGRWVIFAANAASSFQSGDPGGAGEIFAGQVKIANTNSGGTGCPGCTTKACLVFNNLKVAQEFDPEIEMQTAATANYVTWQAATGCPASTPTKNSTWGSVKALYR